MWWAVDAVGRNDRAGAYLALGLTIMFGLCRHQRHVVPLHADAACRWPPSAGLLIYTITGAHLA